MRTVKMKCSYSDFNAIRDWYNTNIPWALYRDMYDRETNLAVFGFWDGDYIVSSLRKHVLAPVDMAMQPEFPEFETID